MSRTNGSNLSIHRVRKHARSGRTGCVFCTTLFSEMKFVVELARCMEGIVEVDEASSKSELRGAFIEKF